MIIRHHTVLLRKYQISLINYRFKKTTTTAKANFSESNDYQFLQRSQIPTLHFQSSLPRLPVPHLEKTCERFLSAIEPIAKSDDCYQRTKKCIEEFRQTIGGDLHAELKLSDELNKHTSYITEPWFDMYLSDRIPLPLNYNPVLVFKHDARPEYNQQILRSTNLVISSLRFWRSLQHNILEPEVYHLNPAKSDTKFYRQVMRLTPSAIATYASYAFKVFPLDMSQYHRLFGVSRIPEINKDRLIQTKNSHHIIVMRQGNFYVVNVLNENGEIEKPNVIFERLKNVVQIDKNRQPSEYPLGCLTAVNRDFWAKARNLIEKNPNNREIMRKIDSALFCLCLDGDDKSTFDYDEKNIIPLMRNMLAGDATNRWFDKSVSMIVDGNGTAAINFEHSWGDGVAVLRYFNEIYKETIENPFIHPNAMATTTEQFDNNINVYPINIEMNEEIINDIMKARKLHWETMSELNMNFLRYKKIGKKFCKHVGLSPDSIMQLSFQLAYRQKFHNYVGTYESCSTAAFKHGRTETVRPCTMATKNFCEAIIKSSINYRNDAKELLAMLQECSIKHGQLTKEAAMGQGFDRHLFGLKNIAIQKGIDIPSIYTDELYKKLNYNIISTSTLGSEALLAGAFGPVVRDGIGIGYSIQNDECGAIVTSYKGGCDGEAFVEELEKSFEKIYNVCQ